MQLGVGLHQKIICFDTVRQLHIYVYDIMKLHNKFYLGRSNVEYKFVIVLYLCYLANEVDNIQS